MITAVLITIGSIGLVCAFIVVAHVLAQKKAERGLIKGIKKWRQSVLPLSIIVDESIEYFEVRDAVNYAIDYWNKSIGVEFFQPHDVDSITTRKVVSVTATTKEIPALANAVLMASDRMIDHAAVFVDMSDALNMSQRMIRKMMVHEFGHLLGLDHDLDPKSVMYGKAIDEEINITQHDIALLREMYGDGNGLDRY